MIIKRSEIVLFLIQFREIKYTFFVLIMLYIIYSDNIPSVYQQIHQTVSYNSCKFKWSNS